MLVYTRLKNADLVAISAEIALKETLGVSILTSLSRYCVWDIDCDDALEPVLERSYYLLNPNKEAYSLGSIPISEPQANRHTFFLKVAPRQADRYADISAHIRTQFGFEVRAISRYTLWQIVVSGSDSESLQRQVEQDIVLSRDYQRGLLVNPILDEYELMGAEAF